MRAFAVILLTVGAFGVLGTKAAVKPGCNGLLAFSSNRAQDAYPEIYAVSLDGSIYKLA